MFSRLKFFGFLLITFLGYFIGHSVTLYFTHNSPPVFYIEGLREGDTVKDKFEFKIRANNDYKISRLYASLDGAPIDIGRAGKIKKSSFDVPVALDSSALSEGAHTLEVRAVDGSFKANEETVVLAFNVDNRPLKAALLSQEYSVLQGRVAHIKLNANKLIKEAKALFLGQEYEFFQESTYGTIYECFLPIDCEEQPGEHVLIVNVFDAAGRSSRVACKLIVKGCNFKKATGFSVSKEKMNEEASVSASDKLRSQELQKLALESPKRKLWNGPFVLPMEVHNIVTPFGEIRATAEKGRYLHKAVDLVGSPKTVIWAAQNGKVVMKDRYLMSGNTVVLDHGCGIFTLYYHLEDFANIAVGDYLEKGNPIGRMGKTGYATGYHLHWELRINNIAVDPLQWTERSF